jgi:hypothetical protein
VLGLNTQDGSSYITVSSGKILRYSSFTPLSNS